MRFYHHVRNHPTADAFLQKHDHPAQHLGKLPHWELDGKLQYVTFRLADSLPQSKLVEYKFAKNEWLQKHPFPHTDLELAEYTELFCGKIDQWLDAGMGECIMKDAEVRNIVQEVIMYDDGVKYNVIAMCIMPNHVHMLLHPYPKVELNNEMGSLKRISAHRINKLLCRTGDVWQHESFDRIVRSYTHLQRVVDYINHNGDNLPDSLYP